MIASQRKRVRFDGAMEDVPLTVGFSVGAAVEAVRRSSSPSALWS